MKNNRNEGAAGVHGEKVEHRLPGLRMRHPGVVVSARTTVVVEYNNYDGYGPYQVEYDLSDVQRAFTPWCEERRIDGEADGEVVKCGGLRDFRGNCPRAQYHVKEK